MVGMINTTDYNNNGAVFVVVIDRYTNLLSTLCLHLDDQMILNIGQNNRYLSSEEIDNNSTGNTTDNNSGDSDDDWNPDGLSEGAILKQALSLFGTIFLVCFITFCFLRKRYPKAYNLRSGWIDNDDNELTTTVTTSSIAQKSDSDFGGLRTRFFSWIWYVWWISDIELSKDCGMDALCLCRVIKWGTKLCGVGSIIGCLFLMPIYATASNHQSGVEQLNTSNISDGSSGRLVATVIAAYLIFGYSMYTCLKEFEWFYKFRYDFLSKPIPRNYSVYVRNLSKNLMTRKSLADYFSNFEDYTNEATTTCTVSLLSSSFVDNNINTTKAYVSLLIPNLQKLVSKRASILKKLEHAINIEDVTGNLPIVNRNGIVNIVSAINPLDSNNNHRVSSGNNTGDVTIVDSLFDELKELNEEIKLSIERIDHRAQLDNSYDGDTTFIDIIPQAAARTTSMSRGAFDTTTVVPETTISGDEEEGTFTTDNDTNIDGNVVVVDDNGNGNRDPSGSGSGNILKDRVTNLARTSTNLARTSVRVVGNQVGNVTNTVTNTVSNGVGTVANVATQLIPFINNGDDNDGIPVTAGFVSFKSLKACQVAKQIIHSSAEDNVFGIEVFEAPGIDDINWSNVGKTHKELQFGLLLSYTLTTTLCFFWTVVIAFIATTASIAGLVDVMPKLADIFEKAPWLEMALAQLAPILIILSNEILKVILEVLSGLEGPVSGAEIQASTFSKLSAFMIIQTFFVSALSGTIVSQITAMVENPTKIISLLANSLPNRSTYFIQILLADTCITLSIELLRVSAVATAAVRSFVGPKLTEKERRTTWMGIRPFADPTRFRHAQILSGMVLYFIVFFVYATLAPITSIFIFICFLFMGAAYRHQFIFIYRTKPDSGGKLWVQFMRLVPVCILIAEVTIVGFLALKTAPIALALMIPLLIITVLFTIYIHQKHFIATDYLPGCDCINVDRKNNIDGPMDMRFLIDRYLQPELRDKVLYPTNASLQRQIKHGMIEYPTRDSAAAVDEGSGYDRNANI